MLVQFMDMSPLRPVILKQAGTPGQAERVAQGPTCKACHSAAASAVA